MYTKLAALSSAKHQTVGLGKPCSKLPLGPMPKKSCLFGLKLLKPRSEPIQ